MQQFGIVIVMVFAACLVGCAAGRGSSSSPVGAKVSSPGGTEKHVEASTIDLKNPGFESAIISRSGRPEGWQVMQHAGAKSYEFSLDKEKFHGGAQALRIQNVGSEPYGLVQQVVQAESLRGKTIAFSAWVKTEGANGVGAGLILRAMDGGTILSHDFMESGLLRETQDWKRYTLTMKIPDRANSLEVGVMLQGAGTVWFDDAELRVIQ